MLDTNSLPISNAITSDNSSLSSLSLTVTHVENNTRVTLHRLPFPGYGDVPDFYVGAPEQASAVWEPEFSLGQLYNKGLFLLGYYNEINESARAILEGRAPKKGTLDQAWQVPRIFEAFAKGPGKVIRLKGGGTA